MLVEHEAYIAYSWQYLSLHVMAYLYFQRVALVKHHVGDREVVLIIAQTCSIAISMCVVKTAIQSVDMCFTTWKNSLFYY